MLGTTFWKYSYRYLAKPIFFKCDPENVHDFVTHIGKMIGKYKCTRWLTRTIFAYQHPSLTQTIHNIHFQNPVGLTAGFDKNAELVDVMTSVGFGFVEVGSITGEPCEGNPKPRLWRLPKSKGLVVYYGLKNDGAEAIAKRLSQQSYTIPVGISIAKTNSPTCITVEEGIADYLKAFRLLQEKGQYITINISCPNTCGGEPFTDHIKLERLLTEIDKEPCNKPIFLKMPVDLSTTDSNALIDVAATHRVHGLVFANLTKKRDRPELVPSEISDKHLGGISGKPTMQASNDLLSHVYNTRKERFVLVGSGGIFTAEDAYEKIRCGAQLLQLATGMIFEGPQLIGEINSGLVQLLKRDGFTSIAQAVGSKHRP